MPDYRFYRLHYRGDSLSEQEFPRLAGLAETQLRRYQRLYTVRAPEACSEAMAICAMADALYYFETAQNGGLVTSAAIGSVSSSCQVGAVDLSPKAQAKELYRCASLYLDISRGCGRC